MEKLDTAKSPLPHPLPASEGPSSHLWVASMQFKYILVLQQDIQGAFSQFCSNLLFFLFLFGSYFFSFRMLYYPYRTPGSSQKTPAPRNKEKGLLKNFQQPRMVGRKEIKLLQGLLERSVIFQSLDSSPKSQIPDPEKGRGLVLFHVPLPDVGLRMGLMSSV